MDNTSAIVWRDKALAIQSTIYKLQCSLGHAERKVLEHCNHHYSTGLPVPAGETCPICYQEIPDG